MPNYTDLNSPSLILHALQQQGANPVQVFKELQEGLVCHLIAPVKHWLLAVQKNLSQARQKVFLFNRPEAKPGTNFSGQNSRRSEKQADFELLTLYAAVDRANLLAFSSAPKPISQKAQPRRLRQKCLLSSWQLGLPLSVPSHPAAHDQGEEKSLQRSELRMKKQSFNLALANDSQRQPKLEETL